MDEPGSPMPASVRDSVLLALADMPDSVRCSPTAMSLLELATSIDQGPETYRFQAALVKELRDCMAELAAASSNAAPVEDDVDDLASRRAARRSGAASGVDAG